ncbi:MAG TPA: hypothetical protein VFS43_31880 [Polyangiaceae bacterium]|nr:hypothetical protein [Polyangiaceae bacterium]
MTLDQARDWCAEQGVTILQNHETGLLTLSLFGSDVSVSEPLADDSLEAWQASFCRLASKLRLRAELKERSRAHIRAKQARSSPGLVAPGGAGAGAPPRAGPGGSAESA